MKKIIKRTVAVIAAICLVLGAAFIGLIVCEESNARVEAAAKEREALLEQRIRDIMATDETEKQSLCARIDELLAEEVVVFDAAPIREQILDIGELSSVTYCYTNVGTVDSEKHFKVVDWKIPFSSKKIVVSMDGILKVGIDVTKVRIDTDEATKTITVTIPNATILSNELDENSLVVHVEDDQLFSDITLADSSSVRNEIKSKAEAKALASGLLDDACEKAGRYIRSIIEAVPSVKDTYTINVVKE